MPKRSTIIVAIVTSLVLIGTIFFLRQIIIYNQQRTAYEEKTYDSLEDFETVQEVAQYMDCEYIKEISSPNENFDLDIYLKFKCDLYTDGASNEEYFYRAAVLFAQVTGYKKIRLIDDSRNLVLAIVGNGKKIVQFFINGNDNYYGDNDTIKALENYKEQNISRMEIKSEILKKLIENEWNFENIDFGTQETTYDDYEIYFDEGIEVKKLGTKVFNIVFTDKYEDTIVNNLKVSSSFDEIEKSLGEPSFGKVDEKIIGYKAENMYIFFEKNRVSIYPSEKVESEHEFLTLLENFRQNIDVKKFVSDVTDLWPNFDKYNYDSDYVDLVYSLKGIKIEFNTQRDTGVTFYNNYSGSYISDLRANTSDLPNYTYFKDENLVFLKERTNYSGIHNYSAALKDYLYVKSQVQFYPSNNIDNDNRYLKDSNKFFIVDEVFPHTLKILSVNGDYPPNEIDVLINDYLWIDDSTLAYSIKNKGIYTYNAETREITTFIEGNSDFDLKKYENSVLYYDNSHAIYGLMNEAVYSYIWLDNTHLAYSIKNQGIYLYNTETKEKNTIVEGTDEFKLIKYENGRIYYDNTNIFYLLNY